MLHGLWRLTWLETKIFIREPLGLLSTVGAPIVIFLVLGHILGPVRNASPDAPRNLPFDLPVLASVLITVSTVLSLVGIMTIYREAGILKRLRATPLRPRTILTAHVLVKLLFTAVTVAATFLLGRRYYLVAAGVPLASLTLAMLFCTISVVSLGFLIASIVPTARLAPPIGTLLVYPMVGLSGLFAPVESLPPTLRMIARALPLTYAVSLLKGIFHGEGWSSHIADVAVLTLMFVVFAAVSAKVFRWE